MTCCNFSPEQRRQLWWLLAVALLIRVGTLGAYPLTDNTEARYAEVAREMAASGDWVVPQLHGQPFWGKPPLSFWTTALGFRLFGVNEFAARLSSLLFAALTVGLVMWLGQRQCDRAFGLKAGLVLATTCLFFVCSGAVMTDAALALGVTLALTAFWRAVAGEGRRSRAAGYLFFFGQAIALLAKGPVGSVLVLLPVGLWTVWRRQWGVVWRRLPWISGLFLLGALTVPWFLAVEARTPGFLDYFIVGEHWRRYLQAGWKGDLYGSPHEVPRGMIWLFGIAAALPWSLLGLVTGLQRIRRNGGWRRGRKLDDWTSYLVVWTVSPLLFFTLARNLLWTYVLPGLPGFALLTAGLWSAVERRNGPVGAGENRGSRIWSWAGGVSPLLFAVVIGLWSVIPLGRSQKPLVTRFLQASSATAGSRLIYVPKRPFSAEFYSDGRALEAASPAALPAWLEDDVTDFFAVRQDDVPRLLAAFQARIEPIQTWRDYTLFREKRQPAKPGDHPWRKAAGGPVGTQSRSPARKRNCRSPSRMPAALWAWAK